MQAPEAPDWLPMGSLFGTERIMHKCPRGQFVTIDAAFPSLVVIREQRRKALDTVYDPTRISPPDFA
jgi:hypothetical protein